MGSDDTRMRSRAGALLAALAWVLAVLSVCLLLAARPPVNQTLWFYLVDATVAAVYGTVGAVILSRRAHVVGWLLVGTGIGGGVAAVGFAAEAWCAHIGREVPYWLDMLNATAWVPGTLAIYLVIPWLVRDHSLGRARWGLGVGILLTAVTTVGAVAPALLPVFAAGVALSIPWGLVTAAAVERRRRGGPTAERNGLGWLALGTALMAVSFLPLLLPLGFPLWATPVLHLAAQALFPAALLAAVLRGRMWGLDLVIRRATLAGLMTLVLMAGYLVVVGLLTGLLPGTGVANLLAAALLALVVQPVRLWLDARVQHLVHGPGADPDRMLSRLGSQLDRRGPVDDLIKDMTEDLARSLRLAGVEVRDATAQVWSSWGETAEPQQHLALRHRGIEVGSLSITLPPGESLGAAGERALLAALPVVAAALSVAVAAREVTDLRIRLSQARLAERKVIRREVHDGVGPALAGLGLGLQGARNLVASDPQAAIALLDALHAEVCDQVIAVRELSHRLLPPVLLELGLAAALGEAAAGLAAQGVRVHLEVDDAEGLPPELAAAAYGILAEALTNVGRHANARHCWVEARPGEHGLVLTVRDDGCGVALDAVSGVGCQSMAERAAEVGGRFELTSLPEGGAEVRVEIALLEVRA